MSQGKGPQKPTQDKKKKIEVETGDDPAAEEVEIIEGGSDADATEAIEVEPEERIHSLDDEVGQLADQNAVLLDSLKRLKADFDNYRKRMVREQTHILETAEADMVRKLLPVMDNLERALQTEAPDGSKGFREGVAMVLEQFIDILGKEGLEVIDPGGEPFDPEHHEAMMVVETADCPEDTVVNVAQKGYRFRGVLLRPAMVGVSCPVKG